ncbi:MAG: hypothetical protein M1814_002831 [Vezdaea aestivalis]|nr:MAG: hypothetical protein M1814_002831 [Vezdaea aestivalis]
MDSSNPPATSQGQQPPTQQQQQQQQRPPYDPKNGGHYGASAHLAAQGYGAGPDLYASAWANVTQGLASNYRDILNTYWRQIITHLENDTHDYKIHQLPLARIKKVMKADPDVKMISAEAPILFAKGCDIFITELTMRAWIHAEENKRRTLQRSDIASALSKSDMFDFLIDIVPREEAAAQNKRSGQQNSSSSLPGSGSGAIPPQAAGAGPAQGGQAAHGMAPGEFAMPNHSINAEQGYRDQPSMYPGSVQPNAAAGYGQPGQPIYADMDRMYAYPPMQQQQQMYHVDQRGSDPSAGQDSAHGYSRHDGGDGDADAEGERDYEVP